MGDNLPLLPGKGRGACGDVRPVLRAVFCELSAAPPAPAEEECAAGARAAALRRREEQLLGARARRVSRAGAATTNLYRLQCACAAAAAASPLTPPRTPRRLLRRRDLLPTINQNCDRSEALWVRNVMARSSAELVRPPPAPRAPPALPARALRSELSFSLGSAVEVRPAPRPALPPPAPAPELLVSVPPQLDFVDFTLGQTHTVSVRLVNVSAVELRLSVRPPARRELSVELRSRLTVTAGASCEVRVHFRPRDVLALRDALEVRASAGRALRVPIACYMRPPLLDVLVPHVSAGPLASAAAVSGEAARCGDVLDLGARLLGDVHRACVLLHCAAERAAFFLLSEDAWLSFHVSELSWCGSVCAASGFVFSPAWWVGGGGGGAARVSGAAWCRAPAAGLHAAALRVLASTAVVRPLTLLADALYYRPEHVTLQAQEKDYDICSEDDPACESFVHLGVAFPHRALAGAVLLLNHSPVPYAYYWSVRPWGACSCWQDELADADDTRSIDEESSERLCAGAKEARDRERAGVEESSVGMPARAVRVEPARGTLAPRGSCAVHVCVPDAGAALGTQRAVLMLILKGVPRESFPPDFTPDVVSSETLDAEPIPGVKMWSREVCDVVCAQLEVWWEVAPLRFVLDPPALLLPHSRRVRAVPVELRATQLFGLGGARAEWRVPAGVRAPPPPSLTPAHSEPAVLTLPLPDLPDERPATDLITLVSEGGEWSARCVVERRCAARHPRLVPARRLLGVVPPRARLTTNLALHNDTYQYAAWRCEAWRWLGENAPSATCVGHEPCAECREQACTCALLRPTRGALAHGDAHAIHYEVNAPESEGCVATLVQTRRTRLDVAVPGVSGGASARACAGSEARAGLVAYRVLAPRLVLRLRSCLGDATRDCAECALDAEGAGGARAVLRPARALVRGRRSCYRLHLTNITPLPTAVHWLPAIEGEDKLRVIMIPNECVVGSYEEVCLQVVVEARAVCARRVLVRRALVRHAAAPLHFVLDAAVSGIAVEVEVPLGDGSDTACMLRSESEVFPGDVGEPRSGPCPDAASPEQLFAEEDRMRASRSENICRCKFTMQYIAAEKRPRDPVQRADCQLEIVSSPPLLSRVCPCCARAPPVLPLRTDPCCLQLRAVPLRTGISLQPKTEKRLAFISSDVMSRVVVVRNVSVVTARWSAHVRRWPRDPPVADGCGVAVQVVPARGVLAAGARTELAVRVCGDTWGVYHDQILLQVEAVEPLVLDVWVEAVGAPLQFALQPVEPSDQRAPILWLHRWHRCSLNPPWLLGRPPRVPAGGHQPLIITQIQPSMSRHPHQRRLLQQLNPRLSEADPVRCVRARNTSCATLTVHAYLLRDHECESDALPLRLYLRLYDVPPRTCPCHAAGQTSRSSVGVAGETSESPSPSALASSTQEMDIGVDLYLAPDCGVQDHSTYTVEPEEQAVSALGVAEWRVSLRSRPEHAEHAEHSEHAPPGTIMLRAFPDRDKGVEWFRCAPAPLRVRVLSAPRAACLCVPGEPVRVALCALRLPPGDVTRVRKRFRVQNAGSGWLHCWVRAEAPWSAVLGAAHAACRAGCAGRQASRGLHAPLCMPPRSSQEVCVEVRVSTEEVWPASAPAMHSPPAYPPHIAHCAALYFCDEDNVLKAMRLELSLEYPVLSARPAALDLGFVCDADTRKTYFTVSHSSPTETLDLDTKWEGGEEFQLWPPRLRLAPGAAGRVYVQYTARWCGAPAEGCAHVRAGGWGVGGAAWCRAEVVVRAAPSRDYRCHAPLHDHTDDTRLLPPALSLPQ